jgi:hypothetical protein
VSAKKRAPGMAVGFPITGPVPQVARTSAKRASSTQNDSIELSDHS